MFSLLINPGNAWLIVLHLKMFRPQHMRLIFWSRHFPSRLRREGFMKRCCPFPTFPRRRMSLFDVGQLSEQTQRKDTVFCAISLALTGNYRHRGRNTKKSRRFACSWESELRAIVFSPLKWVRYDGFAGFSCPSSSVRKWGVSRLPRTNSSRQCGLLIWM